MSYKQGIVEAIKELKDRNGSSSIAIKKNMMDKIKDKKWKNGTFLLALKNAVSSGELIQTKVRRIACIFALQLLNTKHK
jgi:histone H1/5